MSGTLIAEEQLALDLDPLPSQFLRTISSPKILVLTPALFMMSLVVVGMQVSQSMWLVSVTIIIWQCGITSTSATKDDKVHAQH